MRLLLDECLPPRAATLLSDWGHDVATVADLGMSGATDVDVLSAAARQGRLLVTLDTDFGGLLAHNAAAPSVLLIRRRDHRADAIAAVVADVIASSSAALESGALAVVGERTVRLRELPLMT